MRYGFHKNAREQTWTIYYRGLRTSSRRGYRNKKVGSFGDVAAFSFCQDKIMTTLGEGRFLATNNERLFEKAWAFKDHGKNKEKMATASEPYRFKWFMILLVQTSFT